MSTETKTTTIDRASGFSGELWEAITPTYEAIISHPFLASVTDGSLEPEKFVYFVGQDRLYLKAFSRALAYAAGHADNPDYTTLLTGSASTAIAVEAGMHVELLEGFGIDLENAPEPKLSPNGELYVQTILAHSSRGPFANAVASVLACFWIYAEVGKELVQRGSPDPRYQRWIDAYGNPDFAATVARVLDMVDDIGSATDAAGRDRFRAIFAQGCRLEWMFWDAAWRQEAWPIEINEGS
ncbi:MAG: TenA family protein [Solirubrobacterales bacterium]